MSLYANANLEIGYFDARPGRQAVPAQVAFEGNSMTLVVRGEGAPAPAVLYHGQRHGQGHYLLSAPEAGAEATLHRFAGSAILEGFWRANGERGFWRLHLPDEAPLSTREPRQGPRTRARSRRARRKEAV